MKFVTDTTGAQWGVGLTPEDNIRIIRRVMTKPYRDGDAEREEFSTFEFSPGEALIFSGELSAISDEAPPRSEKARAAIAKATGGQP